MAHHAIQLGHHNGIASLGRQADKYAHPQNQDLVGMGVNRIGKQLSSQREQLLLELAILNDQKSSKIIELLEGLRHDSPMVTDRIDSEARAMSTPSDHRAVMDAIKEPNTVDKLDR
jgi:uncharacterized membrane protein